MAARTKIDPDLKKKVVEDIISGKMSADQARRQYKVHPYQVDAWVGQELMRRQERGDVSISAAGSSRKRDGHDGNGDSAPVDLLTSSDPVRAVGEWYIRTVILKEKGVATPPIVTALKE